MQVPTLHASLVGIANDKLNMGMEWTECTAEQSLLMQCKAMHCNAMCIVTSGQTQCNLVHRVMQIYSGWVNHLVSKNQGPKMTVQASSLVTGPPLGVSTFEALGDLLRGCLQREECRAVGRLRRRNARTWRGDQHRSAAVHRGASHWSLKNVSHSIKHVSLLSYYEMWDSTGPRPFELDPAAFAS